MEAADLGVSDATESKPKTVLTIAERIKIHADLIERQLVPFWITGSDTTYEIRLLKVLRNESEDPKWEKSYFGLFRDPNVAAKVTATFLAKNYVRGVYRTINRVDPDLYARAPDRFIIATRNSAANDTDIIWRDWLYVDVDSERKPEISATDDERQKAQDVMMTAVEWLETQGFPDPIIVDSGNGFHLFYRIDMPADDFSKTLINETLDALNAKFTPDPKECGVKIDPSVSNASRIVRLPGCLNRKGFEVPGRKHRLAKLINCPGMEKPQ